VILCWIAHECSKCADVFNVCYETRHWPNSSLRTRFLPHRQWKSEVTFHRADLTGSPSPRVNEKVHAGEIGH
jgi:hypothetical protein